jgi:pyrroloquinoline quinone biosynthesis protein B
VAASADGSRWLLVGASPDLRQQILANTALAPRAARDSPIAAVVLLSADVDGMAGLLVLREQQALRVYAPAPILRILRDNPIFASLDPSLVERVEISVGAPIDTGFGLTLTLLEMPGKVPLYQEDRAAAVAEHAVTYAARLTAAGRSVVIAPGCAEITDRAYEQLAGADVLFFDGTLFTDDEMITAGVGHKTGRRMGHVPISGPGSSLEGLAHHPGRRIYLHINNTNPILAADTRERAQVEAAGWEVSYDGMLVDIRKQAVLF